MKDDFLHQFRKPPRAEFANDLRHRIMPPKWQTVLGTPALQRLAFGLATVTLAFALLFTFSADAWATFGKITQEVGGLMFTVTEQNEFMNTGDETILTERVMSISEARAMLPFNFHVPTWAPAGFELQEQVLVAEPQGDLPYYFVTLEWLKADPKGRIELRIAYHTSGMGEPQGEIVAPGYIEEVQVNGRPAALIQGAWNVDTSEYETIPGLERLKWHQDHVGYTLYGVETTADLIRMAESLP